MQIKKLSIKQKELLNEIQKEKKKELKKYGEYGGYVIPLNHPSNELDKNQIKIFNGLLKTAQSLVNRKVLRVIQMDRTLLSFDLI